MLNLSLTPGSLPGGTSYCFVNFQQLLIDVAANTTVALDLSTASLVLTQDTVPGATQHGNLWFDTRVDRMYRWNTTVGAWLSRHPSPPNGDDRRLWTGGLADLVTYDGGDAGVQGVASGAMWVEDTTFQGRSPMGPGAIPDTTDTLSVAANYGVGKTTLTQSNLPSTLSLGTTLAGFRTNLETLSPQWLALTDSGGTTGSTSPANATVTMQFTNSGGGIALNLVSPVRGAYVIKRAELRQYYKAT